MCRFAQNKVLVLTPGNNAVCGSIPGGLQVTSTQVGSASGCWTLGQSRAGFRVYTPACGASQAPRAFAAPLRVRTHFPRHQRFAVRVCMKAAAAPSSLQQPYSCCACPADMAALLCSQVCKCKLAMGSEPADLLLCAQSFYGGFGTLTGLPTAVCPPSPPPPPVFPPPPVIPVPSPTTESSSSLSGGAIAGRSLWVDAAWAGVSLPIHAHDGP